MLVTHDLGDSVGGEVLARSLEDSLDFDVTQPHHHQRQHLHGPRAAHRGPGDAARGRGRAASTSPRSASIRPSGSRVASAGTFAVPPSDDELTAQWEMASYQDGHQLLARTIRYIEDRRLEERRFTGAIEEHPSPLHIIWGKLDPVARYPMAERLHELRPDAPLVTLDEIGHYPMVEAPDAFSAAMLAALDD